MHLSRQDIVINRPKGGSSSPTSLAHLLDCIAPKFFFFFFFLDLNAILLAALLLNGLHKFRSCIVSCDIGLMNYVAETNSS